MGTNFPENILTQFQGGLKPDYTNHNPEDRNANTYNALQCFGMETNVRPSGHGNGLACFRTQAEEATISKSHELAAHLITSFVKIVKHAQNK